MPLFSRLLGSQQVGMDKAVVGPEPEEEEEKKPIDIIASIFFDGTNNNRANTRLRIPTYSQLKEQVTQAAADEQQANGEELQANAAKTQATAGQQQAQAAQKQAATAAAQARKTAGRAAPEAAQDQAAQDVVARQAEQRLADQAAEAAEEAVDTAKQQLNKAQETLDVAKKAHITAKRNLATYEDKMEGQSHANYYSNISILQEVKLITDETKEVRIYIEGIGTTDNGEDDSLGAGFGAGATGIPAKVSKGIALLQSRITDLLGREKRLETLIVDVFGFSRGASAARHFVSRKTGEFFPEKTNLCHALGGIDPAKVTIRFVGLYETVSSYDDAPEAPAIPAFNTFGKVIKHSFSNDIEELKLALHKRATRVVHLTAADEYRKNFALTTIDSSLGVGGGFECKLPGVHSDIGGGYAELEDEVRNVRLYHRDILIEQGWYLDGTNGTDNQIPILNDTWAVGRRLIPLHYQFITLAIMLELADKSDVKFKSLEGNFLNYVIPPKLKPVADYLMGEVRMQKTEVTLPPEHAWVRNAYLHRSAHTYRAKLDSPKRIKRDKLNGVAFAGREVNKEFQREVFPDNKPQKA